MALSPNAEVLAIATYNNLSLFSTLGGTLDYTIENIYSGKNNRAICDYLNI